MASGTIKSNRLKRVELEIDKSAMTLVNNYYYRYAVTQDHDYIGGVVTGWSGQNISPFLGMYNVTDKMIYCVFGSTAPTKIYFSLYYYEP